MRFLKYIFLLLFSISLSAQVTIKDRGRAISTTYSITNSGDNTYIIASSGALTFTTGAVDSLQTGYWSGRGARNAKEFATLAAAITSLGTGEFNLYISDSLSITVDDTIPSNVDLIFGAAGEIEVTSGDSLWIFGHVPNNANFEGAGDFQIVSPSTPAILVSWFGSNAAAINSAIQSLPAKGGTVRVTEDITTTASILMDKSYSSLIGNSFASGNTDATSTTITKDGNFIGIVITGNDVTIADIHLDGAASNTGNGISIEGSRCILRNVDVSDQGDNGVRIGKNSNNNNLWRWYNCHFISNDSSGAYIHDDGGGAPDTNAGAAFGLNCSSNGLDGLRMNNTIDNQFYGYHAANNSGYGVRIMASADGHNFWGPYTENNTTGSIILESSSEDNLIFGVRSGVDDGYIDNGNDNLLFGRTNSINDMRIFKGNVAFDSLYISDRASGGGAGVWNIFKDESDRDLEVEFKATSANANFRIGTDGSGTINLSLPDGGIVFQSGALLTDIITASATWDPPNLASDGNATSTTITATGATTNDRVTVTHTQLGSNIMLLTGHVQSSNLVRVVLMNKTGGAIDIASGTLRVYVLQ